MRGEFISTKLVLKQEKRKGKRKMGKKMSKYFSFCNSSTRNNQKTKKKKPTINCLRFSFMFRLLFIFVIVALSMGYVFLTNTSMTKGFEISRLENQIAELKQNNQKLNSQMENMKVLSQLEQRIHELDMVSVSQIEYVAGNPYFAVAK